MDLAGKRQALLTEVASCREQAAWHAAEANRLTERAVFLSGAVALLNEQLGPDAAPLATVDHERFWREVAWGNRARRRAAKSSA